MADRRERRRLGASAPTTTTSCASENGGAGVRADRTTVGPHERFFRYEVNKIALKNCT
ncbi:MAG: hypothetical protein R3F43_27935 [bacterium]